MTSDPFAAPMGPPPPRQPHPRSWWVRGAVAALVSMSLAAGGCSALLWRFHHPPPYLSSLRKDPAVRLVPPGPHQIVRADIKEYRRNFFDPRHAAVIEFAGTDDSRIDVAAFFQDRLGRQGWIDRGSPEDVNTPTGLPRYLVFEKGTRTLTLDFLDPGFFDPRHDVPPALRAAWPTVYRVELNGT